MSVNVHPDAGELLPQAQLINVPLLVSHYYILQPDVAHIAQQRVSFGTNGHRGCADHTSFNQMHIVAITQAIVDLRQKRGICGPVMIGKDTHALSEPAFYSVVSVLLANQVTMVIENNDGVTPTPVISQAVLAHNRLYPEQLSDGIVITPSHNPPQDGGLKYNDVHGGPAASHITSAIERLANQYLEQQLSGVRQVNLADIASSELVCQRHYAREYVEQLVRVVNMEAIQQAGIAIGVDPVGGTGRLYWPLIAARYGLQIQVLNDRQQPDFAFVPRDRDGVVRMDCSSQYCVKGLIAQKEQFDIGIANDPDNDRHGIVTRSGLMNANRYIAVAAAYLLAHRPLWSAQLGIGRSCMASTLIDKVAVDHGRTVYEMPVGFKWFVDLLKDQQIAFAGDDSAGGTFVCFDGSLFNTDKDGFIMGLLAAEILAVTGLTPCQYEQKLVKHYGDSYYQRFDAPATKEQQAKFHRFNQLNMLAQQTILGEPIEAIYHQAPGNGVSIGGIKVVLKSGWFAARPSGTEAIYKIYVESFKSQAHLEQLYQQARQLVDRCLT